jgi:hypothetical protein
MSHGRAHAASASYKQTRKFAIANARRLLATIERKDREIERLRKRVRLHLWERRLALTHRWAGDRAGYHTRFG